MPVPGNGVGGKCSTRMCSMCDRGAQSLPGVVYVWKGTPCMAMCHVKGYKSDVWLREAVPLSHEVQKGPPCFLNSFSERSLGAAASSLSPRLGQRFMSKGLCV